MRPLEWQGSAQAAASPSAGTEPLSPPRSHGSVLTQNAVACSSVSVPRHLLGRGCPHVLESRGFLIVTLLDTSRAVCQRLLRCIKNLFQSKHGCGFTPTAVNILFGGCREPDQRCRRSRCFILLPDNCHAGFKNISCDPRAVEGDACPVPAAPGTQPAPAGTNPGSGGSATPTTASTHPASCPNRLPGARRLGASPSPALSPLPHHQQGPMRGHGGVQAPPNTAAQPPPLTTAAGHHPQHPGMGQGPDPEPLGAGNSVIRGAMG